MFTQIQLKKFAIVFNIILGFMMLVPQTIAVDKNGVSPNRISLPKGPGSIEGLGEAFQPTLNTGTAKYNVKLSLPAGVNGHTPSLALQYDSGSGNGTLGFGWQIPQSYVQRQTEKGIPRYVDGPNQNDDDFDNEIDEIDEIDRFINDAKEELVPVENGETIDYFCENEAAFIRYRRMADYWQGILPNGTQLIFGKSSSARIVHPDDSTKIFRWLLEEEIDTNGNTISYHYSEFSHEENRSQKYCSRIEYGPGAAPWENFHFITFHYEDRSDWFEDGRAGFLVRTGKRLKEIVIGTQGPSLVDHAQGDFNGDGVTDNLNRKYTLDYRPDSNWSLLTRVTQFGADGISSLPPTSFDYTVCKNDTSFSAENRLIKSINEPLQVFDSDLVDFIDLSGDGLPDLLKTGTEGSGVHHCYVNQGQIDTENGPAIKWTDAIEVDVPENNPHARNVSLASDRVAMADMNGNGLSDLCQATFDNMIYFANQPKSENGKISWGEGLLISTQDTAPPLPFEPNVRHADIDFDKRTDVIRSIGSGTSVSYQIWFLLDDQKYSNRVTATPTTGFSLADPSVAIADVNGDRVPDIAQIRPTGISVIAGLGHGNFAPEIVIELPDFVLEFRDLANAKLRDISGDGLADLVIEGARSGDLWFWVNLGNYSLSERRIITDLPPSFGSGSDVRWADINGNGTTDLIYGDSDGVSKLQSIDIGELLGCSPRPNMLTRIGNGIGRITEIDYETSTTFMLEDGRDENGDYEYSWPDALPFPVDVVSKVTTNDSLGNVYTTQFKYHNGFYDPEEKQFRGFGRVEQVEIGDESAPTLITRHTFDTGKDIEVLKGKLLRKSSEVATDDDAPYPWDEVNPTEIFSVNDTEWTSRKLHAGKDGREVTYAFSQRTTNTVYERGQTPVTLETEYVYDNYGNITTEHNRGIISGPEWTNNLDDERVVNREFAVNLEKWIIRKVSRETIGDEHGEICSKKETYYDDLEFGQVEIGNPTLTKEWIDPEDGDTFIESTRTRYDMFGNPIAILDPLAIMQGGIPNPNSGHFREIAYDARFSTYPIQETIHVGNGYDPLVIQVAYDEGLGTVLSSTDFNGHVTTYGYDVFSRIINTVKPGDTPEFPTAEYDYVLAEPFGETGMINYVESRLLDKSSSMWEAPPGGDSLASKQDLYFITRQFNDGLGRTLMTKEEAESDPDTGSPRVVVKGAVTFNARQKTASTFQPYYTILQGGLEDALAFEDINAADWQGLFHENGSLISLGLREAHQTKRKYDATLRELEKINPDGTKTRTEFEPLVTRSFDENDADPESSHYNTPMLHYNDGLGRLIQTDEVVRLNDDGTPSEDGRTWASKFQYRVDDALTRIIDSQGNQKWIEYDGLKRKIFMNDPDRGIMNYTYDDASNLIETIDAKGQRTTYTHDGVNRLTSEDYHDSADQSPDVSYYYDEPFGEIPLTLTTTATARNLKGFLSYVTDLSGEEHTSYDERERVEWVIKRVPDPESGQMMSYKIENAYDSMDRVRKLIYPNNDQITFDYNNRNLLEGIRNNLIARMDYTPSGQRHHCVYGNGVRTNYGYDSRLRLNTLLSANTTSSEDPLISYGYTFDGASNITQIRDQRPGNKRPDGNKRRNTQIFDYDNLYRLTRVQYSLTLPGAEERDDDSINYRYDRTGNMLAKTSSIDHLENGYSVTHIGDMSYGGNLGSSNRVGRQPGDAPGPHALTSTSEDNRIIDYDDNGNMISLEGATLAWDFKDRLVRYEKDDTIAEYTYDYTDRRIVKRVHSSKENNVGGNVPVVNSSNSTTLNSEPRTLTTVYIDKLFEIRDNEQPTKFAFDGANRVARFTKMLDNTTDKTQWVRLRAGWNFISFYVQPDSLSFEEAFLLDPNSDSVYGFDNATSGFVKVDVDEAISVGRAFMVYTNTPIVVPISGIYNPPDQIHLEQSLTALNWPLSRGLSPQHDLASNLDQLEALQAYDSLTANWQGLFPGHPDSVNNFPDALPPAQVTLASLKKEVQLQINTQTSLDIRFYHGDHLGSSSVVTDGNGKLVEETVFYPFGHPRNQYVADNENLIADYGFTGKEKDQESGLQYFEARYQTAHLGRFISVDPLYAENPRPNSTEENPYSDLKTPQKLNLYAYTVNNPVRYIDPDGLDETESPGAQFGRGYFEFMFGQKNKIDYIRAVLPSPPSSTDSTGTKVKKFGAVLIAPVTVPIATVMGTFVDMYESGKDMAVGAARGLRDVKRAIFNRPNILDKARNQIEQKLNEPRRISPKESSEISQRHMQNNPVIQDHTPPREPEN